LALSRIMRFRTWRAPKSGRDGSSPITSRAQHDARPHSALALAAGEFVREAGHVSGSRPTYERSCTRMRVPPVQVLIG